MISPPAPSDIGAPLRYSKWRHLQWTAVLAAAESQKRFVIQGAPTGFGKSLVYVSQALLTSARTIILTSTKALQSQLLTDFNESGLIEIKGMNAYECVEARPTGRFGDMRRHDANANRGLAMSCDEAPCQSGAFCDKRDGGCLYYDANRKASMQTSKLIVTNYAYWMSINKFGEGLGEFDLLVLDEAHNAVDELGGFIGTALLQGELETAMHGKGKWLEPGSDREDWVSWGAYWANQVTQVLDTLKASMKESERTGEEKTGERLSYGTLRRIKELKSVQRKLDTIRSMSGEWVIEWGQDRNHRKFVKFDPVWPGEYAEGNLFLGVSKVVMVSATVRPKTADMLGIKAGDLDFKEYPSSFPKKNRPIIFLPTAAINYRAKAEDKRIWHTRMDQIIERRIPLNYKGIIHSVSYDRMQEIYDGSRLKEYLLIHDRRNIKEVMAQFRLSNRPLVLISPVLDTGYDFPGDLCRYQIIAKVPFPVTIDEIMKARTARDPEYRDYVTMVKLVQMAGRPVRAEDDWAETFIVDSDFGWWFFGSGGRPGGGKVLAPKWFTESVRKEQMLGTPLRVA